VRLVDSHAHLNAERFADDDAAVAEAARASGVERLLVPGWNVASSERALELVERLPWLDVAIGVHPHDAAKVDDPGWARIVELAADPRVVAIGETGLDYDRAFSPIPAQLTNLRRNLRLAMETARPAILHCRSPSGARDAQDALLDELRRAGLGREAWSGVFRDRPPAVVHSFSGPVDYARAMLDLGCAISFSGLVFRRGEETSAAVAALVPDDRLLVETDSPFLAPPGAPRGRNEPGWVRVTAAWLAERRQASGEAVGEAVVAAYDLAFGARRQGGATAVPPRPSE
jgi:TatD DNase family protein